ncbi:MAG: pyridoxamine 5'-phosphate oxidase [Acidimicrobiales bacterium]
MSRSTPLRLYGRESNAEELEWDWVDGELTRAGTYWVTARTQGHPHPRPVWGVWMRERLYLSIGTLVTVKALAADPTVTVHLESGTEVVIVEGTAVNDPVGSAVFAEYDRKYDWSYDVARYGPFTCVVPALVLAWRTAGWAGRESFQQTGRWRFS